MTATETSTSPFKAKRPPFPGDLEIAATCSKLKTAERSVAARSKISIYASFPFVFSAPFAVKKNPFQFSRQNTILPGGFPDDNGAPAIVDKLIHRAESVGASDVHLNPAPRESKSPSASTASFAQSTNSTTPLPNASSAASSIPNSRPGRMLSPKTAASKNARSNPPTTSGLPPIRRSRVKKSFSASFSKPNRRPCRNSTISVRSRNSSPTF